MRKTVSVITLTALLSVGCASPPDADQQFTAEDEAAIRALVADWDLAFEADDTDAIVALYTEDYLEMRPDIVSGRDEARARIEAITTTYGQVNSTLERIEGRGDMAWGWASLDHVFTRDGVDFNQRGNALWAFKRDEAGQWRIQATSWQSRSTEVSG